jgi:hypothetical protein
MAAVPIPGTNHSIVPPLFATMPFGITVDGDTRGLKSVPLDILKAPPWHLKPLLIGSNKDEGTIFLNILPANVPGVTLPLTDAGAKLALLHFFNETTTEEILLQYRSVGDNNAKLETILRDFMFLCPSIFVADTLAKLKTPVFLYQVRCPISSSVPSLSDCAFWFGSVCCHLALIQSPNRTSLGFTSPQFIMDLPNWLDWDAWGDYHTIEYRPPPPPTLSALGPPCTAERQPRASHE